MFEVEGIALKEKPAGSPSPKGTAVTQPFKSCAPKWPGDVWGGLAALLVALPSSIAYGLTIYTLLGPAFLAQGALAGMLGAILIGLVAPAFGGSARLISAPCAPAAAVLSSLVLSGLTNQGPEAASPSNILAMLFLVPLLAGLFQCFYGFIRAGRLIKFIPYPVVSGYLNGVAVLIFLGQAPKFLGLPDQTALAEAMLSPKLWQGRCILIGLATIAGFVLGPRLIKKAPAPIVGLLCGSAAYFALALVYPELRTLEQNQLVVGRAGSGMSALLPTLHEKWRGLTDIRLSDAIGFLWPALTLSVLLSIDTLKTCVVVDALTRSRHDSNRELIGQGLANFCSAMIGGMPGAGTMGATLVNVQSGGSTRWSGVFEGGFALLAFLVLGDLIAWIPIPALAGILVVVAWRMLDRDSLHLLKSRSTALDFAVIVAVIVVAVVYNLIAAAGTGVALAVLLFVRDQIHGSVIRRKVFGQHVSSKKQRLAPERESLARSGNAIMLCELQGTLFFGTSDQLFTELEEDLKECRWLILDMRRVQSIDFTTLHVLDLIKSILQEHHGFLIISHPSSALSAGKQFDAYLKKLRADAPDGNVRFFGETADAIAWAEDALLHESGQPQEPLPEKCLDLQEIELFREFSADGTLAALARCIQKRSFNEGDVIFRKGEPADQLLLIRRGSVRIQLTMPNGRRHTLAYFGTGNFFGEMAFLDRGPRSADAVAITNVDLFVLSRTPFETAAKPFPLLGVKIFARLARALSTRLRYADAEISALHDA